MARTTTRHTIICERPTSDPIAYLEGIAAEAIKPGQLIRMDASEEMELHATAGGVLPGTFIAVETLTPDTITYPTTPKIDIPYAAGDTVYYVQLLPGYVVNMFIANGETSQKGITQLVSNGDGNLKAETVDANTLANSIVGTGWQDVTASGAAARCRVRA